QGGAYQLDNRYKVQVDPTVSVRGHAAGTHDAKIGAQLQYDYRTRDLSFPGGSVFQDQGDPLEAGLCDPTSANPTGCFRRTDYTPFSVHQTGMGAGAFVQDRWWTPLSWLTVIPGLRVDWGRTLDRLDREVTSMVAFAPRLGLTLDLTGDSRNV